MGRVAGCQVASGPADGRPHSPTTLDILLPSPDRKGGDFASHTTKLPTRGPLWGRMASCGRLATGPLSATAPL
jgi:hypothetical protein